MSRKNKNRYTTKTDAVGLITLVDPTSTISEQYRTVRTNIQFAMSAQALKSIVVTSAGPSEGKSTTSANLAVVFASAGHKVLLIDADLRKPTVHKTFQLNNGRGFSSLLSESYLREEDVIQGTSIPNLSVITSGPLPPNPSELLGMKRCDNLIANLAEKFDLVIYDMPPVVAVTDAQIVAAKTDGVILAVRQKVTNKAALEKAKGLLDVVNARILGAVLNGVENDSNDGYYYAYEYK